MSLTFSFKLSSLNGKMELLECRVRLFELNYFHSCTFPIVVFLRRSCFVFKFFIELHILFEIKQVVSCFVFRVYFFNWMHVFLIDAHTNCSYFILCSIVLIVIICVVKYNEKIIADGIDFQANVPKIFVGWWNHCLKRGKINGYTTYTFMIHF